MMSDAARSAKRAEYLRNRERYRQYGRERTHSLRYAKIVLGQQTGVPPSAIPDSLAAAKLGHIKLLRELRRHEEMETHPQICAEYLAGATVRELAGRHGFSRANVANIIKRAGIRLKMRPHCKRGHEFTPENTFIRPTDGVRICRACNREKSRRHAAKKAAVLLLG